MKEETSKGGLKDGKGLNGARSLAVRQIFLKTKKSPTQDRNGPNRRHDWSRLSINLATTLHPKS